jgi:RNA-directed DNA polymerase
MGRGRGLAKGNATSATRPGPSAGSDAPNGLDRVRKVARRDKEVRFTALLHHVTADRLREAHEALDPKAAMGVDFETWGSYGQDLEENLQDLHRRVHSVTYRAKPSRRAYIPETDGGKRPLAIAALEDKILQFDHNRLTARRRRSSSREPADASPQPGACGSR